MTAGLLVAVAVGVALMLFLVLYELDHVGMTELQLTPDRSDVRVAGEHTEPVGGLLILRFDGPLYTANCAVPTGESSLRSMPPTQARSCWTQRPSPCCR